MQRDCCGPIRCLIKSFLRWGGELKEPCRAPALDGPVWGLEVCFTCVGAEACEVVGFEEERVCCCELVLVAEDGGWEGEVCV